MANEELEDFLSHYGVLGMRWGKRKAENRVTVARRPGHEDHELSRKVLRSRTADISTKDLSATNQRLKQEKTLRDIRAQSRVINRGQNYTKAFIGITGTVTSVIALSNTTLGKEVISRGKAIVTKLFSPEGRHTIDYVAPVIREAARHLR